MVKPLAKKSKSKEKKHFYLLSHNLRFLTFINKFSTIMSSSDNMETVEPMESDDSGDSIDGFDDCEPEITHCLFCDNTMHSLDDAIKHLETVHKVSLVELKTKFHMDHYSYIKMINYIRKEKVDANVIATAEKELWNHEKYLKPLSYEPWLSYDIEGLEIDDEFSQGDGEKGVDKMFDELKEELEQKNALLQQVMEDITKMRKDFRAYFEKDTDNQNKPESCVSNLSLKADEGYFSTYSHFAIHHDMLSDTVRTLSYKDAFLKNKTFISGKRVLDVGCGTSILSMFAAQAGADKIVGIDNSEIIYTAMDIIRKNNFTNIELVKGRLEDTNLPIDKFDVIVSEWMGYFLIFEGMLDTIIYARDRHLKSGGTIMPNRCNISLIGYGDESRHQEYITFWDSVYGFDMTSMKKDVLQEPSVEICKSENVLTEPDVIADYDLNTVNLNYSNFAYDFNLKVIKRGRLTSFVGYFDTFFDLPVEKVSFSTSPHDKPTHWKQVVFFLDSPVEIKENDVISGKIICQRNIKDLRSLKIKIKVFGKEYCYHLD